MKILSNLYIINYGGAIIKVKDLIYDKPTETKISVRSFDGNLYDVEFISKSRHNDLTTYTFIVQVFYANKTCGNKDTVYKAVFKEVTVPRKF